MKTNSGFEVSKIKQLGDRVFEKILADQNIDAFNGAQGRIFLHRFVKTNPVFCISGLFLRHFFYYNIINRYCNC